MVASVAPQPKVKARSQAGSSAFERLQETRANLGARRVLRDALKVLLQTNQRTFDELSKQLVRVVGLLEKVRVLPVRIALSADKVAIETKLAKLKPVIEAQQDELQRYQAQVLELENRVARREVRAAKYLLRDLLRQPEVARLVDDKKAEPVVLERHCGYDAW